MRLSEREQLLVRFVTPVLRCGIKQGGGHTPALRVAGGGRRSCRQLGAAAAAFSGDLASAACTASISSDQKRGTSISCSKRQTVGGLQMLGAASWLPVQRQLRPQAMYQRTLSSTTAAHPPCTLRSSSRGCSGARCRPRSAPPTAASRSQCPRAAAPPGQRQRAGQGAGPGGAHEQAGGWLRRAGTQAAVRCAGQQAFRNAAQQAQPHLEKLGGNHEGHGAGVVQRRVVELRGRGGAAADASG